MNASPRRSTSLESVLQDLRCTFRTLRRDAGFAVFAILIVGLGIGASSTVFSVASALLMLTIVAVTAGYLPARRASRIDPMSALRCT